MQSKVLSTPVDSLVEFVKEKKKTSIAAIVTFLKLPQSLVDKWLVILEEFGILTLSYKGLEGFVQIVETKKIETSQTADELKSQFISLCKEKGFDYNKISKYWISFLDTFNDEIKKDFVETSKKKGYQHQRIEMAWKKYELDLKRF